MINHNQNGVPGEMRLRDLKNGLYQIHSSKNGAFEGHINPICRQAVLWGILEDELMLGFKMMKTEDHDYAEFGIFGKFIYSACDLEDTG